MGSGKTLLLTILAMLSTKKIYSNYHLKVKDRKVEQFTINSINSDDFDDAIVLIDEVYTLIDSRSSMSDYNRLMSYILFQSRKKSLDMCITAQLLSVIDVRYRNLIDYLIMCEKREDCFYYQITNREKTIYLKLPFEKAEQYYGFYNTNEIVNSDRTDELKQKFLTPSEKSVIIDSEYNRISKLNAKITKPFVKFQLIHNSVKFDNDILEKLYLKLRYENCTPEKVKKSKKIKVEETW